MTPHDPTSLDTEERALAQRLARLGPHGEPSPALDSRVLAAAHAAVEGRRLATPHGSRRWPLGLGVAASLALALGLAWQLRPLPDVAPAYRSEADSALRTAPVAANAASDRAEPVPPPPPAETAAAESVQREAAVADTPQPATRSATAERIAVPAPQPAAATPRESPIASAAPAATQAMQVTTPPAPAKAAVPSAERAVDPSAAALPATASAPQAFGTNRAAADAGSASSPVAERAPDAAMQSESTRQKTAVPAAAPPVLPAPPATAADQDMPIDDVPPATVASPQVRDAWLARIRELAADGNIEEARASLREFQHRYPDYPLPQELRALLP
jgi:resuscitation-promoting factor RpfA